MMAKDSMVQDMFLVGPPGAGEVFRRRLAFAYAQLTKKPIEILTISGDLTESDLKQRREITQNNASGSADTSPTNIEFIDQAPVRAAKHGRLLILDGIEKSERNVLPTLNNLLENREMHLEDGTMLLPSHRIEQLSLSSQHETHDSSSSFLIPVHPDFRVIALGIPSPPFPGRSLDPPIRSRFQIRRIENPSSEELYEQTLVGQKCRNSKENKDNYSSLAKSCAILASAMEKNGNLFPSNKLHSIWKLMKEFPLEDRKNILRRAYPVKGDEIFDTDDTFDELAGPLVQNLRESESVKEDRSLSHYMIKSVNPCDEDGGFPRVKITFMLDPELTSQELPQEHPYLFAPTAGRRTNLNPPHYIAQTATFRKALTAMIQEHAVGNDFLLVSSKGEGKTTLAQGFAATLGYDTTHLFAMNTEMTSHDLLARRSTDPSTGETQWEDSPLMRAARQGEICVLDGVEKLRPDVLSSIQSLIVDRDISLPDGRRVLRHDRIIKHNSATDDNIVTVNPSFRVIALASLPKGKDGLRWITPSLMAMFTTIRLPSLTEECLRQILSTHASSHASKTAIDTILALRDELTDSVAEECGISPLSTRNMVQVVRRMGLQNSLYHVLSSIFLFDLLPQRQRRALETVFNRIGVSDCKSKLSTEDSNLESIVVINGNEAKIGSMTFERGDTRRPEMVPSPNAFDIPAHTQIIQDLLLDWKSGERAFLLLGNQGVGKNKIVDRICEIANWEREYIQLHRDSTIGQLTLTPQLKDGKIVWNDSPLIRALRDGCVLLVDEADKAPVEVVSILKGLVEDGELLLADGRRISRQGGSSDYDVIKMNPNFSLWVLANRPGYPFLGNDFFREIGDCFNTRVVNNPDLDSEIRLLSSYAPSLETSVIHAVASSFSDLRHLSDIGDIAYPYSTREAIAVVKHLEKYPDDGLAASLYNILDFDSFDELTYSMLGQTFQKYGIAISDYTSRKEELLGYHYHSKGDLGQGLQIEYLTFGRDEDRKSHNPPKLSDPKFGKWDDKNEAHVGGNQWAGGTGGSDTAGLGGRGGPYRLDRGHRVHQVSNEAKEEVSEQAKLVAKQIAKKALDDHLQRIKMGQEDYEMYKEFSANIQNEVSRLKNILANIESRGSERGWLKRQSYGDIDDAKLVDGITGDKYIYKRRGSIEDSPIPKRKQIRFVMDVSGSMYRFNGYDQRLVRCLEAALLVMEGFHSDVVETKKFDYSIVGHSGDSPCIQPPFVDWSLPPKNKQQRLQILQTMLAHSQYCMSGDFTLEAMRKAIDEVSSRTDDYGGSELGNQGTVICLSDANLARYGIDPGRIRSIIESGVQKGVKVYIVFIASFGKEADAMMRALPIGSAYTCMETTELPRAVREILTSGVLT
ncbi:unnamed protein product [Pseudo-nitzschia multistriata]|uniref:ATPase dynein-related AAA domain-containing protein n=1 Tax=Pseudo-nitzschia multistriata TaxID=183589 RepID=A0A448ZB41_9STRA|nr:unnamed protein product [Pseudo-nitzschia multistriata]